MYREVREGDALPAARVRDVPPPGRAACPSAPKTPGEVELRSRAVESLRERPPPPRPSPTNCVGEGERQAVVPERLAFCEG